MIVILTIVASPIFVLWVMVTKVNREIRVPKEFYS